MIDNDDAAAIAAHKARNEEFDRLAAARKERGYTYEAFIPDHMDVVGEEFVDLHNDLRVATTMSLVDLGIDRDAAEDMLLWMRAKYTELGGLSDFHFARGGKPVEEEDSE
jgi:hypothetical protein